MAKPFFFRHGMGGGSLRRVWAIVLGDGYLDN